MAIYAVIKNQIGILSQINGREGGMYKKLKQHLKKYPLVMKVHRSLYRVKLWMRDVSSAYLSKSTKMRMTPLGFKLIGSNSIHHVAMQEGTFEPEETILFKEHFQGADVFVDVGANIGFYTCLARLADKHVIAVEPLPKNLEYLYANILGNDWNDVEVFPVGLSNSPGLATLYGGSSTGASLIGNWAGASQLFRRIISVSTLDILLGVRLAGKKILIKIDVEGAEYPVLLGATNVMRMQPKPTWVVEICLNEFHPDGMNPNFQDTFNLFWQYGYEARTADKSNQLIQRADVDRWVKNGRCDSGAINYKFVSVG
jgi:FkbM family methyltransferase